MKKLLVASLMLFSSLTINAGQWYIQDPLDLTGTYISSATAATHAFPTSTQWGDVVWFFVPPGNSLLSGDLTITVNGSAVTAWDIGMSTSTGNDAGLLTLGQNWGQGVSSGTLTLSNFPVSLTNSTTYFLKVKGTYSGVASPRISGHITAVGTKH